MENQSIDKTIHEAEALDLAQINDFASSNIAIKIKSLYMRPRLWAMDLSEINEFFASSFNIAIKIKKLIDEAEASDLKRR
jgi:hypothetical protein